MKNNNDKIKADNLEKVTIRLTPDLLSVIDDVAANHGRTRSEVIRLAVDRNLLEYLDNVTFVKHDDAEQILNLLANALTEIKDINNELSKIGVNYNQALKLKQLEKEYKEKKEAIEKDCKPLDPKELDELMTRFEKAVDKVGDISCLIRG